MREASVHKRAVRGTLRVVRSSGAGWMRCASF
jgi:hypothetical protein